MLVIAALAVAVMMPRLLSAQFGLLDDGIIIDVSRSFVDAVSKGDLGFPIRLEAARGRFRPLYWLYEAGRYAICGSSALGFFMLNGLMLVSTALFVSGIVAFATQDRLASLLAGVAYVLSPPVVENYYTAFKPEVPLALWLAASLCCWAGARVWAYRGTMRSRLLFAASAVSLLGAYFTKETAQAVALVSALWVLTSRMTARFKSSPGVERLDRLYLSMNLAFMVLFWIGRGVSGTVGVAAGDDSRHYALTSQVVLSRTLEHIVWYIRDFPLALLLLAFLGRRGDDRVPKDSWPSVIPLLWIIAWTVIMLPWHSVLEYYLLPASLGVALITGTGAACALRSLAAPARSVRIVASTVLSLALVIWPLTLANAVTNGRVQIIVDAANARFVDFLATHAAPGATVLFNIPEPNEYVVEVAAHLSVFKGRRDVRVGYSSRQRADGQSGTVLVATPVMKHRPLPGVRFGVSEAGATHWREELLAWLDTRDRLVYRDTERVQLLTASIPRPICALLRSARANRELFCGSRQPLVDTRKFVYGWEVYRLGTTGAT